MIGQFFSHSAVYTLGALLSRGVSFLLLPLYTYTLTAEHFAIVDYLTIVGAFVAVTVALEIAQAQSRFIPEVRGDAVAVRKLASTALWFTLLTHLILVGVTVVAAPVIAPALFSGAAPAALDALPWAAVAFLAIGLVTFCRAQLRAELKPRQSTAVAFVHALLVLGCTAFLLLRSGDAADATLALKALALGGLGGALFGLILCRRSIGFSFSFPTLIKQLGFSAPLVLSSVGVVAAQFIDRVMIVELLGIEQLAPYAVAGRVALMVSLLMVGFQNALTPLVYSSLDDPKTPGHISDLLRWFTGLSLIGISALILLDEWIIALIAPASYAAAENLTPILVIAVVLAASVVFFPGLSIARKTGLIAVINLAAAAVNIALNLLLIPLLGLAGAAIATFVSAFVALSGMIFFSQRAFPIPMNSAALLMVIVLGLGVSFTAGYMTPDPTQRILHSVGALLINIGLVVTTGLITRDELGQLHRRLLR